MISLPTRKIVINGVSLIKGSAIKRSHDACVLDGCIYCRDGVNYKASPLLYAIDTPRSIIYESLSLSKNVVYRFYGTVYPVGTIVHFVKETEWVPKSPTENEFASVQSDEDGNWSVENIDGWDGNCIVWCEIRTLSTATSGSSLICKKVVSSMVTTNPVMYTLVRKSTHSSVQSIAINGDCPESAEKVHVSLMTATPCPECLGAAMPYISEMCDQCSGTHAVTQTTCLTCDGTGSTICIECGESIMVDGVCPSCGYTSSTYQCSACSGTGTLTIGSTCPRCTDGQIYTMISCENCGGTGSINSDSCLICDGTGKVKAQEQCDYCGNLGGTVNEFTTEDLIAEQRSFANAADSIYKIDRFESSPDTDGTAIYVVWCYADSGTITAKAIYGGPVCLSGDTPILMADGSEKLLQDIVPGDLVKSSITDTTCVTRVMHGTDNPYHTKYYFEDGSVIDETHAHRFYNIEQGFWQRLGLWKIGEHAIRYDGAHIALVAKERIDEPARMFGLWTESCDYYANGLLSGDAGANKDLLSDATIEQAVAMAESLDERKLLDLLNLKGVLP